MREEFETGATGSWSYKRKRPIGIDTSLNRLTQEAITVGLFSTPFSVFFFLSAASVALFSFLAVASWTNARRRERESYYKNEMLKKISEASGHGVGAALALLREEDQLAMLRRRAGYRIGGLVTASIGLALMVFLRALIHPEPVFLCGLIPLLPGLALFASSYLPLHRATLNQG